MGQTISACRAVPCHSLPGKQLDQAGLQLAESSLISKQFREGLLRCTCLAVFLEAIRARSSCPSTSLFSAMPQQCLLAAPSVCIAGCQPACWPRLLTCGWGSWLLSSWRAPPAAGEASGSGCCVAQLLSPSGMRTQEARQADGTQRCLPPCCPTSAEPDLRQPSPWLTWPAYSTV